MADDDFVVRVRDQSVEFRVRKIESQNNDYCIVASETVIFCDPEPLKREQPDINRYDHIGGAGHQLSLIRDTIEIPLKHPIIYHNVGAKLPHGVLLYGPSGTGKTLLAHAVGSQPGVFFFQINGPFSHRI